MDWQAIESFARHYWPDVDETWQSAECRAYYARQWLLTLQREQLTAA